MAWEPTKRTYSLLVVMRRTSWLLLSGALAGVLIWPTAASAKGSTLRFTKEQYAPGDHAVAHAQVETWKGSGQPEDGPYTVYLVRGRQPLWFGHLPRRAIEVGELEIGALVASDTYRVKVSFEVPRVPDGRFAVWVCGNRSGGTGCLLGFGDLVYGEIVVASETGADSTVPYLSRPLNSPSEVGGRGRPADDRRRTLPVGRCSSSGSVRPKAASPNDMRVVRQTDRSYPEPCVDRPSSSEYLKHDNTWSLTMPVACMNA